MGDGFRNDLIAGDGSLVYPALRSPNFASGASGWTINKDGSAEFNDVRFRGKLVVANTNGAILVYRGTPAAGTLVASIAGLSGVDDYGNNYLSGYMLYETGLGSGSGSGLYWQTLGQPNVRAFIIADSSTQMNIGTNREGAGLTEVWLQSLAQSFLANNANIAQVRLTADALQEVFEVIINSHTGLKIGAGPAGKYYAGEFAFSTQSIPSSAASTTLSGLNSVIAEDSDYGSSALNAGPMNMSTGIFTVPVAGWYQVTFSLAYVSWVANSRLIMFIGKNGGATTNAIARLDLLNPGTGVLPYSLSALKHFAQNDTIRFQTAQVTGAAVNVDVNSDHSYCSIRRAA